MKRLLVVALLAPLATPTAPAHAAVVTLECDWNGYYDPLNLAGTRGEVVGGAVVTGASYVTVTCDFEQNIAGTWQYIGSRSATAAGPATSVTDMVGFSAQYPTRVCTSMSSDRGSAAIPCSSVWPLV